MTKAIVAPDITGFFNQAESSQLAFIIVATLLAAPLFAVILDGAHARGLKRGLYVFLALPLLVVAGLVACYEGKSFEFNTP